ncbi:hypothetical protein [Spiroplasma endosymbiont of Danaus chrysippus]|uniref:hypothetical protein n=1 Tax=Spiroplasma endosymbiont of Danaus chrysippus TaxID=2691041 RepID=UPI00157A2353|nr:hypothetical protein [Spiroplasma endosymbiont of Danaus chrysippus]
MNLWDFLKYSDKYNVFKIYTKNTEIYFSWNGGSSELDDDRTLLGYELADWKVLSYKQYPNEIKVFIELDNQEMCTYNHFPKTKEERLNYNKE